MSNKYKHIESLLNLFMQGETTIEQERELRHFFATTHNVPQQWLPFKEMMAYFDDGMPIDAEPSERRNITRHMWLVAVAAAVAAIIIMVLPKKQITPHVVPSKALSPVTAETATTKIHEPAEPEHHNQMIAEHKTKRELKEKPRRHQASRQAPLDAIDMEREQGEVEQAQQELMADKFIIEQERQEVLQEQYSGRARVYQARQSFANENPQLIQVVFK